MFEARFVGRDDGLLHSSGRDARRGGSGQEGVRSEGGEGKEEY